MFRINIPRHAGADASGVDTFDDYYEGGDGDGLAGGEALNEVMSLKPRITSTGILYTFHCGCAKRFNVNVSWAELCAIAKGANPAQLGLDPNWHPTQGGFVYTGTCDCPRKQLLALSPGDALDWFRRSEVQHMAAQDPQYTRVYAQLSQRR